MVCAIVVFGLPPVDAYYFVLNVVSCPLVGCDQVLLLMLVHEGLLPIGSDQRDNLVRAHISDSETRLSSVRLQYRDGRCSQVVRPPKFSKHFLQPIGNQCSYRVPSAHTIIAFAGCNLRGCKRFLVLFPLG